MIGDVRLKSIWFEEDDVVVWYSLEVGENSQASCSYLLPYHVYKEIGSDENLMTYIKKRNKHEEE